MQDKKHFLIRFERVAFYFFTITILVGSGLLLAAGYKEYNKQPSYESAALAVIATIKNKDTDNLEKFPVVIGPTEEVEIITLNDDNSISMNQAFDPNSVQKVMLELQKLSDKLPKDSIIYLVMNTPGGSVDAGFKLIAFAKALPQKIKTITIFAASMGFITVQQLDERLILANGTLMSHPASFGVEGQTPYQVLSRTKWIMSMLEAVDQSCADRMQLSKSDYQSLVHDEYWTYDSNAVNEKAADRKVLAKCGEYASRSKWRDVETMFGTFSVEFPSCPLIPGYISVKAPSDATDAAVNYVKLMFTDRDKFTKQFITNNKYLEFQR